MAVAPPFFGFDAQVSSVTGQLGPIAVTTNCDALAVLGGVVAQPVNMFSPMTLTTNRSSTCRRRRFLKPKKHSTAASIVPGNIGLESCRRLAVVLGTVTVTGVVPVANAVRAMLTGENEQVAPTGRNPEQEKATPSVFIAAFAVIVNVVVPVPFTALTVRLEAVIVMPGIGRLITYTAVTTALL